jgi:hypothetical protein
MNTVSIDFQPFVDWDNSPFVLFDYRGKILYLNNAAELLFGYVTKKELYDLALAYAPKTFGYKTTTIRLDYDNFSFYAITVGYENEEQLSLRLYHTPRANATHDIARDNLAETDINVLLEANIALFQTKNKNHLELLTDPDIPTLKVDQNRFSKLLRKTLDAFRASDSIRISLKLLIGEHILINGCKYPVAQLSVVANDRHTDDDDAIRNIAQECHINVGFSEHVIRLDIPLLK